MLCVLPDLELIGFGSSVVLDSLLVIDTWKVYSFGLQPASSMFGVALYVSTPFSFGVVVFSPALRLFKIMSDLL